MAQERGFRHFCRSREQYIPGLAGEKSGGVSQRLSKKNASSTRIALPSSPMRVSSLPRNQGTVFRHSSAWQHCNSKSFKDACDLRAQAQNGLVC